MGTKPVRIDNRKREKARRRRQTAAARAAVLFAAVWRMMRDKEV